MRNGAKFDINKVEIKIYDSRSMIQSSRKNQSFPRKSAYSLRKSALCRKQRGFVVLYTVLIATIILAITIGIALIAYNQVILSSSVAEGGEAFFAADSGAECALYWDRDGIDWSIVQSISCDGRSILSPTSGDITTFYLDLNEDPNVPNKFRNCAAVTVDKGATDEENNTITEIISLGYNVDCFTVENYDFSFISLPPRTIQRAIRVTY